jgi:hypothetical protein
MSYENSSTTHRSKYATCYNSILPESILRNYLTKTYGLTYRMLFHISLNLVININGKCDEDMQTHIKY